MLMSVLFWHLPVWIQSQQHSPIKPLDTSNQYWLWLRFQKWDGNRMPEKMNLPFPSVWSMNCVRNHTVASLLSECCFPGKMNTKQPLSWVFVCACKAATSFLEMIASLPFFCGWLHTYQMGPKVWSLSVAAQLSAGQQLRVLMILSSSLVFYYSYSYSFSFKFFLVNSVFGWGPCHFWVKCFQPDLESLSGKKALRREITSFSFWHSLPYSLNIRKAIYRACTVIACLIFHQLH